LSRCIKAVPSQKDHLSDFLIGLNTNTSVEIIHASYDSETKKISQKTIYDFKSQKENYNDILGIYSKKFNISTEHVESDYLLNIFCQVYNNHSNNYELKMLTLRDEIEIIFVDLPKCTSKSIFGYN
jgi:hypothetical protein